MSFLSTQMPAIALSLAVIPALISPVAAQTSAWKCFTRAIFQCSEKGCTKKAPTNKFEHTFRFNMATKAGTLTTCDAGAPRSARSSSR